MHPGYKTGLTIHQVLRLCLAVLIILTPNVIFSYNLTPHTVEAAPVAPAPASVVNTPTIGFTAPVYTVSESVGTAIITVTRGGDISAPITANVVVTNATALVGRDYTYPLDGGLDPILLSNIGSGPNGLVSSVAIQNISSVLQTVVVGYFTTFSGITAGHIARLQPTGLPDTAFNNNVSPGFDANAYAITTQPTDNKLLVGGDFTHFNNSNTTNHIARLNTDGTFDNSFTGNIDNSVFALAVYTDSTVLVGGNFSKASGKNSANFARLDPNGQLLTDTFKTNLGTGPNGMVQDIAVQPDGKILLGGSFTKFNGTDVGRLVRLNPDGTLDSTFVSNVGGTIGNHQSGADNSYVAAFTVQPDGKILVGGNFSTFDGYNVRGLVRLNSDGSFDNSFAIGGGANSAVSSLAIQPTNGKILASGYFTAFNSIPVTGVVRINLDGSLDSTFISNTQGGANNPVLSLATLSTNGRIVLGGSFSSFGVSPTNHIARLDAGLVVRWAANDNTPQTVRITIPDNTTVEGNRNFLLGFANTVGATPGGFTTTSINIIDNDISTTITSTPQVTTYGQPVVFTTTVLPVTATGSLTYYDNGTSFRTDQINNGQIFFTLPNLTVGTHLITTTYGGDANFVPSSSSVPYTQVVNPIPTNFNLDSNPNPSIFGQTVVFTGTISPQITTTTTLTGTISFYADDVLFDSKPVVNGQAVVSTSNLSVGQRKITANYDGGSNFMANAGTLFQQVNLIPTVLSVTVNPQQAPLNSNVKFSIQVTPTTATGVVTLFDATYSTTLAVNNLNNGATSYETANLITGTHTISIDYSGDTTHTPDQKQVTVEILPCNPLSVTSTSDNGDTCGTLRYALLVAASNQPPTKTVTINLARGSVITTTSGLSLAPRVNLVASIPCTVSNGLMTPPFTIFGNGNTGPGLTLQGGNTVTGIWIRGFLGSQLLVNPGSTAPVPNKLLCVKASKQ